MEHLKEIRDRIMLLPILENRMEHLKKSIQKAEDETLTLLVKYEKESRDVEQLKKESLSSFLLKLIGKYEDRLEIEQNEEINGKLAYDRMVSNLDNLKNEKEQLASRILELRKEGEEYQRELENRRRELFEKFNEPEGKKYGELEKNRKQILSNITEIKEALSAASGINATAQKVLNSLKSAEGWATYDAFTRGGIISHISKYSHLDEAEEGFHKLSSQLTFLKAELGDIKDLNTPNFNGITTAKRTVDFWFDNIFTDFSVRGQIKNNAEEIKSLLKNIEDIQSALNIKLREEDANLIENRRLEEELLLNSTT